MSDKKEPEGDRLGVLLKEIKKLRRKVKRLKKKLFPNE